MINPTGNQVYITQNMHIAAKHIGNQQGGAEYAQLINAQLANEKESTIKEVKPLEETSKIDPDREHQKHHEKDTQEEPKYLKEHEEKLPEVKLYKILDIKA